MVNLYLQALISGILIGGVYALIGIGLTMIFGVMRVINFAHGEIMMVGMYLTYVLFSSFGLDPYIGVIITIPLMFLLGAFLQVAFINRILGSLAENQILLTVGIGLILTNLAQMIFTSDYKILTTSYSSKSFTISDLSFSTPMIISFGITLVIIGALYLFLKKTNTGQAIFATAQDRDAARLMGINVNRMSILTFGLGSALAGVAGALFAPTYYIFPQVGGAFTLKAFIITVLGGMGSVVGAGIGGVVIGVAESVGAITFSAGWKDVVVYVLFLTILLLKPSGLFGKSRL